MIETNLLVDSIIENADLAHYKTTEDAFIYLMRQAIIAGCGLPQSSFSTTAIEGKT